ncbi:hypothetical protein GJ744_003818 [Endocarpon pusillum]|uniref:Uncharacterized protein n=1 Tax=Endocarpon pusillum TaxID=364733 RepID=A0A8H7AV22_9EURO|nr:hypothetical protein GJ744_003818 [Endocarpon pusillum]
MTPTNWPLKQVPLGAFPLKPLLRIINLEPANGSQCTNRRRSDPGREPVDQAVDLCNIVTGTLNTILAIPLHLNVDFDEKWALWGMMAVRTTMSAIVYFINPDSKLVKRVISCFSAISGIVQAGRRCRQGGWTTRRGGSAYRHRDVLPSRHALQKPSRCL